MPVRDGGDYLQAAVDSILAQDLDDLELILVDDRSRDGALDRLQRLDGRVRRLAARGEGVVAAFNTGLTAARGAFIARMDADDIARPRRLSAQLAYLQAHPDIAIAGCRVRLFSEAGIAAGNRHYQRWLNDQCTPEAIRRALFVESPIPNPGAFFRRAALEALGGYADPDWPEDYDLFLRADALGLRMGKPDPVLLDWRDHGRRLTRTDDRYARAAFQRAKAHYLVHGRGLRDGLLIWGAGPTGRDFHDLLRAEGASVDGFVDVHPRRIGGAKRGRPVWDVARAADWGRGMVLVAVGARGARADIRDWLTERGRVEGGDYLFIA